MALKITRAHVWTAKISDHPGGLAEALTALAQAGANLEFILARRQHEDPGTGIVFVAPVKGRKILSTANASGFAPSEHVVTLKVTGVDTPGLGAQIAGAVADAGINLRGFSATVVNGQFACHLGFDTGDDAANASAALRDEFRHRP